MAPVNIGVDIKFIADQRKHHNAIMSLLVRLISRTLWRHCAVRCTLRGAYTFFFLLKNPSDRVHAYTPYYFIFEQRTSRFRTVGLRATTGQNSRHFSKRARGQVWGTFPRDEVNMKHFILYVWRNDLVTWVPFAFDLFIVFIYARTRYFYKFNTRDAEYVDTTKSRRWP